MENGLVQIFCGEGKGKTTAAIGKGILAASEGKTVIVIQFLKKKQSDEIGFLKRLEPEIKVFRFERSEGSFACLTEQERQREIANIRNGLNFARKVLCTHECDVLILDEVLGLPEAGVISAEEIKSLIDIKRDGMDLILTGIDEGRALWDCADEITVMQMRKHQNGN